LISGVSVALSSSFLEVALDSSFLESFEIIVVSSYYSSAFFGATAAFISGFSY
jgi:hypothetical protein